LLTAAVLLATPAQASHSISAIGALATGVWYLAMGIIGFGLLVGLVVAYLSPKRKQKGIPIYVWLPLILFTLLVFYRFTHPRLELETAVIVGITLLNRGDCRYYPVVSFRQLPFASKPKVGTASLPGHVCRIHGYTAEQSRHSEFQELPF
jgi:hypothetical protein